MSRERPSWRESADQYWCRLQRGHWRGTAADWTTTRVEWASKCDQLIAEVRQWAGADELDGWSPDLADRADAWASWQEEVELRAALEEELAEYQRQMEAAYARQQYEDRENDYRLLIHDGRLTDDGRIQIDRLLHVSPPMVDYDL